VDGVPRIPNDRSDSANSGTKRHGDAAIALVLAYAASREVEAIAARWDIAV
jgi:phage FluMu gp28-like protein